MSKLKSPSTKYFQASAELDALQEQLNKTREHLENGIGEVRLNCFHAFEVCWKDPKDPKAWSVYPPSVEPHNRVDISQAHSRCVFCGVEGGNAEVWSAIRRRVHKEAVDMHMTDEELYGLSVDELEKAKSAKAKISDEPFMYDAYDPKVIRERGN